MSDKYLLWIDGVGGFLVCLGQRVTVGQAVPGNRVDVPLFADLGRRHAVLTRDEEGYLLKAVQRVQINGQDVARTLLHHGDRLTLGQSCQLRFLLPVGVSATARLELVSEHRLPLAVEAVFLMADTLVLGPGPSAHVTIPALARQAILYRHQGGLAIRVDGDLAIDGQARKRYGRILPGANVCGDGFSLALEKVTDR